MVKTLFILLILSFCCIRIYSQSVREVKFSPDNRLIFKSLSVDEIEYSLENTPLVSFRIDEKLYRSSELTVTGKSAGKIQNGIELELLSERPHNGGWKVEMVFRNRSSDTLKLENVVPYGENPDVIHITGSGDHYLSRSHLFRPGFEPVNVILPDNAWELGYSEFRMYDMNLAGLCRRVKWNEKAQRRRFETVLFPGGEVTYNLYIEAFKGNWQEGLRKVFQEKMLYDVEKFDNTLFERTDLKWVRHTYLCQLMMGWDHDLFDSGKGKYTLGEFIDFNNKILGGAEIYGLWPTWPALGMDQRNQWDMYRNMPGGIEAVRGLADLCHRNGSHFYIAFKPWDTDTRHEDPYAGLARSVHEINADGVVLDCSGSSTTELQQAADNGGRGVVMYSEGMAVPKDMQGIVSGRVHNALYYCPVLNLNKLIKPEFGIFRVVEVGKEKIKREYSLSLFNGYGTENNLFSPGRPWWLQEQWEYLGKILMIQRENSECFTVLNWIPLAETTADRIFVNKWPGQGKTVYTIFSQIPEGFNKPLFEITSKKGTHWIDLWNHEPAEFDTIKGKIYIKAGIGSFSENDLGTNNEGAVGVLAEFTEILESEFNLPADELTFSASRGNKIRIWAGMPGYQGKYRDYSTGKQSIRLLKEFGREEGKFVVQLFEDDQLIDERLVTFAPASARLISQSVKTPVKKPPPDGMVTIPYGRFTMNVECGDQFIPYPEPIVRGETEMAAFYMDRFPVTNRQFSEFIRKSGYKPSDPENYLKHWAKGKIQPGHEDKPVVYISWEDAKAYAKWVGKRLPTEMEWQYAAQTGDLREWPWGDKVAIKKEKTVVTGTLTVEKLSGIDTVLCNPGNGILDPVGIHTAGANPYGLEDLVGSVWQLTNDVYDNCTYSFIILKGGSYFKPGSSWWYVQGGPKNLRHRQMLLRVSQGFERNATVGFRCVSDFQ